MMGHINAGNLNKRLPVYRKQMEIDTLAISFNRMLERIETSFKAEKEAKERIRQFVSDASHELRTPLTSIHGFIEVSRGRDGFSRSREKERSIVCMKNRREPLG